MEEILEPKKIVYRHIGYCIVENKKVSYEEALKYLQEIPDEHRMIV